MLERVSEALKKTMSGVRHRIEADEAHELRGTVDVEVLIEEDDLDGGFVATCVNVPGAASQGETPIEAMENLSDALGGVLAARFDRYVVTHERELLVGGPTASRRVNVPVQLDDRPKALA